MHLVEMEVGVLVQEVAVSDATLALVALAAMAVKAVKAAMVVMV
jgi:hypothetical protein